MRDKLPVKTVMCVSETNQVLAKCLTNTSTFATRMATPKTLLWVVDFGLLVRRNGSEDL